MSYMRQAHPNGSSTHINGNGSNRLQRFDFEATPDNSADERSRSRGPGPYGASYGSAQAQPPDHVRGVTRLDRQHANRRSRDQNDYSTSRSRSRPGVRHGMAGTQVEEILRYIEQHWNFMASDSCVPVKVALQLMDSSSLGLADQYQRFGEVHQQLQNALKVIVNEHHQGFNSSIGTFHKIQAAIHTSQQRVRALRAGLIQSKNNLGTTRPELKSFAASSQSYDQMLHMISSIETLRGMPDILEVQISEKRFLAAVETLQEALALIRKPEMDEIGALSDLKVYLSNQEHSLTDILIEELHSHLYLKSPYTEERWKAHMNRNSSSATVSSEAATVSEEERAMYAFLDSYDGTQQMQEDPTRNPEAGTFYYIQLLVESIYKLGKLEVAVDAIEQRLPVELFRVVDRSHGEVEQRHPQSMMRSAHAKNRQTAAVLDIAGPDADRKATLEDLLATLYAKFEAISEGHRVLHDVTAAVLRRDQPGDIENLNRSFRELWKLLQSEIRSLLHDHLATNGNYDGQKFRSGNDPMTNIFRTQPRDRNRKIFKLSDTDSNATDLTTEREDLEFILKSSVPGLVNTQKDQQTHKDRELDRALRDRSAAGHKLLVEPTVFNMGILLPPSLAFLNRLKEIVPPKSTVVASTLTSFLDDFLINVFYPQLDETLLDSCSRAINELEAFQIDQASISKHSARPIFKGTARFFELVEAFCTMLDSLPHEQSFSQLVIDQMRRYYDKCYQWSKSLLQRTISNENGQTSTQMRLAADIATKGGINDIVLEILRLHSNPKETGSSKDARALAAQESAALINRAKNIHIDEADLIHDKKALAALCTLHTSMKWLAARCTTLRYISPKAIDMANMQAHQTRRWTVNALASAPSGPYLPLDAQTATQFDAVIDSFTELSQLVLRTLHIDLRLHLLYGIYTALDTTYVLGHAYTDPDPAIPALSATLVAYDTAMSTHLLPPQYNFLTANLSTLVNDSLCHLVSAIPAMDHHGVSRMELNVLVLQQALKNVQADASLEPASKFYGLAAIGPEEVVTKGPKEGYEAADLKALARLCYNAERDGAKGSVDDIVSRLKG